VVTAAGETRVMQRVIGWDSGAGAGAAVGFHLDDGAAGGDWSGALGVGGAKDSDDREANGGGYVHRAGVVADERWHWERSAGRSAMAVCR